MNIKFNLLTVQNPAWQLWIQEFDKGEHLLVCHVHLGETVAFKKTRNFVHDIVNENLLQCSWQQTLL